MGHGVGVPAGGVWVTAGFCKSSFGGAMGTKIFTWEKRRLEWKVEPWKGLRGEITTFQAFICY